MRQTIEELRAAVKLTPDNIALRLLLALRLFKLKEFDESEKNYQYVLKLDQENIKAKQGLLELYYAKANYSAVIVIAEELANRNITSEKIMELHVKSLLRQNNTKDAQEVYNKLLNNNPFYYDEEIDSVLSDQFEYNEDKLKFDDNDFEGFEGMQEINLPSFLNNPEELYLQPTIDFEGIIGMDEVKNILNLQYLIDEINDEDKVSYKLDNSNSLLLYGPPGCGKTFIVSSIPSEFEEDVLLFDINKMSEGQPLHKDFVFPFYFNLCQINAPLTFYIEDIEHCFGKNNPRSNLYMNQFENEMDNAYRYNLDFMVVACSTYIWQIDQSLFRYGRFDRAVFVAPPSNEDRLLFFKKELSNLKVKGAPEDLVELTHLFSYADLQKILKQTKLEHLSKYFGKSKIPAIGIDHFIENAKKSHSSIKFWFDLVKKKSKGNFKQSAIYNEISEYMERMKI